MAWAGIRIIMGIIGMVTVHSFGNEKIIQKWWVRIVRNYAYVVAILPNTTLMKQGRVCPPSIRFSFNVKLSANVNFLHIFTAEQYLYFTKRNWSSTRPIIWSFTVRLLPSPCIIELPIQLLVIFHASPKNVDASMNRRLYVLRSFCLQTVIWSIVQWESWLSINESLDQFFEIRLFEAAWKRRSHSIATSSSI
jgi:hypothetical protein